MLNIIVCIKQVLDPEASTSAYKIDAETKHMTQKGMPPVMSPFDENALATGADELILPEENWEQIWPSS